MTATGQCLCGEIKYELAAAPTMTGVCHCKNCQRQAGSAFSTLAGGNQDRLFTAQRKTQAIPRCCDKKR